MKKRELICILGLIGTIVAGSFGMKTYATSIVEVPAKEIDLVYEQEVQTNRIEGWIQGPQIYSESGIVMDMDTGAILYAKNIHDRHYPASITKVMTALVAFQNYDMNEMVQFTWDNIGFLEYGDAHIGIKPDEVVRMEDCMYGMLLASANEVSHAIGSHMEGGYDVFLAKMNKTAKEIGCLNSNWKNTHGLHDAEHYTSAYDMALIGSEVFQYEKFREITGTHQHVIPETNITDETRTFQQNHDMIWGNSSRYYEPCVGGKTGYTDQALTTLVTFATKDDKNLVAVVLRTHGGGQNAYADTRAILDYGFDNFTKNAMNLPTELSEKIESWDTTTDVVIPKGISTSMVEWEFEEPVQIGNRSADIIFTYKGQVVGKAQATISQEYHDEIHNIQSGEDEKEESNWLAVVLKILLFAVICVFILVAGLILFAYYRKEHLRKRRRMRRNRRKNRK